MVRRIGSTRKRLYRTPRKSPGPRTPRKNVTPRRSYRPRARTARTPMLSREVRDNIVGFMNPFSGTRPKIMDGECFSSSTISHRDTESHVVPQNKTAIFYIQADIMVPLVFQTDITSTQVYYSKASADVMKWDVSWACYNWWRYN